MRHSSIRLAMSRCSIHNSPLAFPYSQHSLPEGHQDLRDRQEQRVVLQLREMQLHGSFPDSDPTDRRPGEHVEGGPG